MYLAYLAMVCNHSRKCKYPWFHGLAAYGPWLSPVTTSICLLWYFALLLWRYCWTDSLIFTSSGTAVFSRSMLYEDLLHDNWSSFLIMTLHADDESWLTLWNNDLSFLSLYMKYSYKSKTVERTHQYRSVLDMLCNGSDVTG